MPTPIPAPMPTATPTIAASLPSQEEFAAAAAMAGTRTCVGGRRCHLRQRRVPAMVNGARHHTLYAHAGQCSSQKPSALRPDRFTHLPESNSYLWPVGQQLNYGGHNARNRTHVYIGSRKHCGTCAQKAQCTSSPLKYLAIHIHEPSRQRARDLANTPGFVNAQRQRKKVEALFSELKNQIGLRRLRLRRLKFVCEQFFLAAAAQNIKRLVRFLSRGPQPTLPSNDLVVRSQKTLPPCALIHSTNSSSDQPFFNNHLRERK